MMIDNLKLTKNKWYRITNTDGVREKMRFMLMTTIEACNKGDVTVNTYVFFSFNHVWIINDIDIKKIESYKKITPDEQAREMGCLDEYKMYMTANDKKLSNKYIYKTIFNKNK